MGKPYQSEVAALPKTVSWTLAFDVEPLASFIRGAIGRHLTTTGSGGSLSAATLAAQFHQLLGAGFSESITPLEITSLHGSLAASSFLLLSAGGANKDILAAFKYVAARDPYQLAAMTARLGTPLGKLTRECSVADCVELDLPSGKDGFLATNSLAGFAVVLARAYSAAMRNVDVELKSLRRVVRNDAHWRSHLAGLDKVTTDLWERDTLVVLYPPQAKAGAIDLESKFTESALGHVHIADYRHFAHGRHHWLAKRGPSTAILAFINPQYRRLAEKTLACLPSDIPVARVELEQDPLEAGVNAELDSRITQEGIEESAQFVHGFSGGAQQEASASVPCIWMPLLGEAQEAQFRVMQDFVKPNEILPILPSPARNPRRADNLVIEYREALFDSLRLDPRNFIYAHERNPFEVYRQLNSVIGRYRRSLKPLGGARFVLAALSSKLMSLGPLLVAYELKPENIVGLAHVASHGYQLPEMQTNDASLISSELFRTVVGRRVLRMRQ